jgi:hypothetical protein
MGRVLAACAVALAAALAPGCKKKKEEERLLRQENAPITTFTHVVGPRGAAWFDTSPEDARTATGRLPAGTRVQVFQEAGRFWQMKSEDGVRGYVERYDLVPIPK